MSTPMPPEEPFEDEARHRIEEEAEEHVEEVRRERAAEHVDAQPGSTGRPASDLPWWRRLFRRS